MLRLINSPSHAHTLPHDTYLTLVHTHKDLLDVLACMDVCMPASGQAANERFRRETRRCWSLNN